MESQERVWDEISGEWCKYRTVISPTVKKFLEDKTGNILDVGCGSGRNFMKIDELKWSAIDFSESMVELAKKNAKERGIELNIKKSKTCCLPFEDNYFDVVLFFAVMHCVQSEEERFNTLKEMFRVMKNDGEALISSWGKNSPRLKDKEGYVPWTTKENEGKQLRYTYIFDLEELVELCKKAGFEIVSSWEERNVNVIVRKTIS